MTPFLSVLTAMALSSFHPKRLLWVCAGAEGQPEEIAPKGKGLKKHPAKGGHVSHGVALISPSSPATFSQQWNYTDGKGTE